MGRVGRIRIVVLALIVTALYGWRIGWFASMTGNDAAASSATADAARNTPQQLARSAAPKPDPSPASKAHRMVNAMDMDTRIGQLVMAPLYAGNDPASLASLIADRRVGSVLIIGKWTGGVASVRAADDQLQGYAPVITA